MVAKTETLCLFQINDTVGDHLAYSDVTITDLSPEWVLIADEGEMKVFKMELEEDGIVVDPIKAVHTVRVGVPLPSCRRYQSR